MKQLLVFILALMAWTALGLYAEDFVAPSGSTIAITTPIPAPEPFVWPVAKTIAGHTVKVVSKFGRRKTPNVTTPAGAPPASGADELHEGIDFAIPAGTNVRAARAGKVLFAGYSTAYVSRAKKSEKSHLIIVRHSDGKSTRYVHLERLLVKPGSDVNVGDVLATSSASDEWSDSVLHFEIRDAGGQALDPMIFLAETSKIK